MYKILLVDDDPTFIKMLATHIEKAGYSVDTASDGHVALALLKKTKPDLLVLDILMPTVNGYEVAHYIKSDPDLENMPIILFSSHPFQPNDEINDLVGIYYLNKSCNPKELTDKISRVLERPATPRKIDEEVVQENFKEFFKYDHNVIDGIKRIIKFRIEKTLKEKSDENRFLQD
ncbi:MAG: response regulator [Candidatus Omnitrophica bacterium]|nr:response regulator [Candidatus Omnitrophota bacterium]